MGNIAIEGNIIPHEWYNHLRNEKGRVQMNAITILADLIYWYRPVPIYDIKTGLISGYGRKFKEDLLQRSYRDLEKKFGLSENQIRTALIFLEEKGLAFREFRNINVRGHILNNVMYLGINPKRILEITKKSEKAKLEKVALQTKIEIQTTKPSETILPFQKSKNTYLEKSEQVPQPTRLPSIKNINTNTKISSKTSSFIYEINESMSSSHKKENRDWLTSFSKEQSEFSNYLINLKPALGKPITMQAASWWIKHFGIDKIKIALHEYFQWVEKAKKKPTISMPHNMAACIRHVLNKETHATTANTDFFKPKQILSQQPLDHSLIFTIEQKKFLNYLLKLKPEIGEAITKETATWWIKHFGIEKIKIALKVYWQQVDKAKINPQISMPQSIGAYVRDALNKGIRPCMEADKRNKAFADSFKHAKNWTELTLTDKYCRAEGTGKDWYYYMPENLFIESLVNFYENYCDYSNQQAYQKVS